MLKKVLLGAAIVLTPVAAFAVVPNYPSPWDPGNALGTLNGWVQSQLNPNISQVAATLPAPVTTGGATIETDFQYSIPANALNTGNIFHIKTYGVNSADGNAKTVTFSFGGSTCAIVVTASGANWEADFWVTETGSKTQTSMCNGEQGTARLANVQATNWTVDNTAPIAVLVRQTAATSGTMTLNESWMDYIR